MQETFLQQVIRQIPSENDFFANAIILLPTKRACLSFRDQLVNEWPDRTLWLPTILSIEDFLYQHSQLTIVPDEDLLVALHRIHVEVTKQDQDFASFYRWGQMILKDFNEIDQYLIDTDYLFHYVKEFKEIETESLLNDDQRQLLNQFWDSLPREAASKVRQNFLQTWESLGKIYKQLNKELDADSTAYPGRAYRSLLQHIEQGDIQFKWKNFIIVGFNALSTFEERLFQHLCSNYDTKLYWDIKKEWLDDRQSQPAYFIRQYVHLFPENANQFISVDSQEQPKMNVEVTEIPMDTIQPDYALELVQKWGTEHTVIVLCDESLVYPLTFQLQNHQEANITMGFPAAMSAVATFVKDLLDLKSFWWDGKRLSPSILLKVLNYAGLRTYLSATALKELESRIHRWGFINQKDIDELFGKEHAFFGLLISDERILPTIAGILRLLPVDKEDFSSDHMIANGLIQSIEEMDSWMIKHNLNLPPSKIWELLRFRVSALKIPFEHGGNNVLQVMGFLETRNLDFKNIIILSADDNHLPGTNKHASFIPFSIKKGLAMPTYRENEAIYSYHFYRLIQRAENVALIYSPQANGQKQSRSRFVEQVLYEWSKEEYKEHVQINEMSLQVPVPNAEILPGVRVGKKETSIREVFSKYLNGEKQFSASSLSTYIQCPVQFYLKNIAGLIEPEEFSEDFDYADLGKVFHRAMELFYQPSLDSGELLNGEVIRKHIKERDLDAIIQQAFEEEDYDMKTADLKGQNLLVVFIISEFMKRVLEEDAKSEAFKIIGLELRLENIELEIEVGRKVKLKGFLDRVDEVHSLTDGKFVRIVDYKTGKTDIATQGKKELEDYFRIYFEDYKYKEGFQGYLYSWMYHRQHPGSAIKTAFYSAKNMSAGLIYLSKGVLIDSERLTIFEHYLTELITDILEEEIDFIQSEDAKAYEYSAFSVLVD